VRICKWLKAFGDTYYMWKKKLDPGKDVNRGWRAHTHHKLFCSLMFVI